MQIIEKLKNRAVGYISSKFYQLEKWGVHVSPVHFYYPTPDTKSLSEALWDKKSSLIGIDMNDAAQLAMLSSFRMNYKAEYENFPKESDAAHSARYFLNNGAFESVDGEILYCMVRALQPKKIIEIGSGFSTYLSAQALLKNQNETGINCELVAIEPYPNKTLKMGFPGLSRLIPKKIQDVPLQYFDTLEENDILFIDSSHVLKIGSDVETEYLEILPRLKKGVFVHIHDIFLPTHYPKNWIQKEKLFWNEQYLLQAFLTFNDHFEVIWAGNYMHLNYPEELQKTFGSYNSQCIQPGSFWIKKIK